ncbi:paraquat-inducible protein A [Mucilaginibacter sp. X4EP1]|uniref:paraquat-inducible protein A n=1 Tax=Mucilaginibacter sp. X4EP1 TaxID=2723092 RepID=UPI002168F787|nr:paraquat-inducible protein A [Mucilaginibacter sp. X4EP1]MCS3815960.1 hypothetical protein [Mucilaginibacter sp. X4EP1]
MKLTVLNILLLIGLTALLCGETWCGYRAYHLSAERKAIKEDYSLSNSVTFGLFSIDQWRDRISEVIHHRIQGFHITPEQQKALEIAVEKDLHGLVSKTVAEINKPQHSLGGKLKKMAFNAVVDSGEIQEQVKPFARAIIKKVSSPESETRLKHIATSKFGQLEQQTYDNASEADDTVTSYLYRKYHVADPDAFNKAISKQLAIIGTASMINTLVMLGCVVVALLLWWLMRKDVQLQVPLFIFALLFAFVLLAVGSTTAVIEVDARIQTMQFELLGEKVGFQNQVLFFQTKSILGTVNALIAQQKPDTILVGVLILLFVLVLPIVRLLARGVHLLSKRLAKNKVVHYLAFESAKWDMADVMIVGLVMTYIGLNGILKSQLSDLNMHSGTLSVVTANDSTLQPGYFIFVGYVLFAALLSYILKKITPHQPK